MCFKVILSDICQKAFECPRLFQAIDDLSFGERGLYLGGGDSPFNVNERGPILKRKSRMKAI